MKGYPKGASRSPARVPHTFTTRVHPMEHYLVYITCPSQEQAKTMAAVLLRERLIACANIFGGSISLYWWRGEMRETAETLCLCKTTKKCYPALEERIKTLHPYEVPCIVALPLVEGFAPFLWWIAAETADPGPVYT